MEIVERHTCTHQTIHESGTIETVAIENVTLENVASDQITI